MEESNVSVKVRGLEKKLSVICIEVMIQRQRWNKGGSINDEK